MQNTVDKLIKKANLAMVVGTSSWREQFIEALEVSAGNSKFSQLIKSNREVCRDEGVHNEINFPTSFFIFIKGSYTAMVHRYLISLVVPRRLVE